MRSYPYTLDVPAALRVPPDADGSIVVALHGQGLSPAEFADDAAACAPPRAAVLLPQAPLPFEIRDSAGAAPPRQGNGWYVWTGDDAQFVAWMDRSAEWLLRVIDGEAAAAGLDARRVALLGWSQGGYLAGYVGVTRAARFRALVVAAARIKDEALAVTTPAAGALPVLAVHGERDRHVAADAARASVDRLAARGLRVDFRTYPRGHAVLRDETCRADVREFLAAALG